MGIQFSSNTDSVVEALAVSPELWGRLLRPLTLINCLQLETVCKVFAARIYTGQHRFIWTKRFQDFIYKRHGIQRTQDDASEFLEDIAGKIGPHCRQMILKLETLPHNHMTILLQLKLLQSLYLKIQHYTDEWYYFATFPDEFNFLNQTSASELRIFIVQSGINYLPDEFAEVLQANSANIKSLELWKSEQKFRHELTWLQNLRKFRIYINSQWDNWMHFFIKFAYTAHQLDQLHVRWEASKITPLIVAQFREAIAHFTALRIFSLEINWSEFIFQGERELYAFKMNWIQLCHHLPATIEKMSINVEHMNFRKAWPNSKLIQSLVEGRKLKLLRVVASVKDVFPLRIGAESVDTLVLVFSFFKLYREIAPFLADKLYTIGPKYIFELEACEREFLDSVKTLKLKHCFVFERSFALHIGQAFPNLEKISFRAFHKQTYLYKYTPPQESDESARVNCFMDGLLKLMNCPKLRVIKLEDKFKKPDLSNLVEAFAQKALNNPDNQFALYIDKMKNCHQKASLLKSVSVPNLRIF